MQESSSRLDCDVGIDGSGALFKSALLGLLAQVGALPQCCTALPLLTHRPRGGGQHDAFLVQLAKLWQGTPGTKRRWCLGTTPVGEPARCVQYDWRVGALVRLVKLWAGTHDINDSSHGTLNSHALTLLVSDASGS